MAKAIRSLLLLGATACALVACSGGDDDDTDAAPVATTASAGPDTTTAEAPVTAPPEPQPATTAPPTIPPVATDPPATVATESTGTTGTTAPDVEALLAEFRTSVETDWREGHRLWLAAVAAPGDTAAVEAASAYMVDAVLTGRQRTLGRLVETNRRGTQPAEAPSTLSILVGPDPVDDLTAEATLTYCTVDATVVVEAQADGSETVVNDAIVTEWWDAMLRWSGERWQVASLELLDKQDGIVPCV